MNCTISIVELCLSIVILFVVVGSSRSRQVCHGIRKVWWMVEHNVAQSSNIFPLFCFMELRSGKRGIFLVPKNFQQSQVQYVGA